MVLASLEIRPLLDSATLTLRDLQINAKQSFHWRVIDERQIAICSGDKENFVPKKSILLRIHWPESENEINEGQIIRAGLNQDPLAYCMSFKLTPNPGDHSIEDPTIFKNWSLDLTWPKCVDRNVLEKEAKIICSSCQYELCSSDLRFTRCLPLPSIFWREFSQEWFCGCCEGIDKGQGQNDKQKNKEFISNKMTPRSGDILFAPGLICINSDLLSIVKTAVLICTNCQLEVGFCKNEMAQFWQHSVSVVTDSNQPPQSLTPKDTFVDMLRGILTESPEKTIKLYFTTSKRVLHLWIMEQKIRYYTNDDEKSDSVTLTKKDNAKKVMFKLLPIEETGWKKDIHSQEVSVSEEILTSALCELELGEKRLLQSGQFRLAFI